jgi:hypothetical protein
LDLPEIGNQHHDREEQVMASATRTTSPSCRRATGYIVFAVESDGTHRVVLRTDLHHIARRYMRRTHYSVIAALDE